MDKTLRIACEALAVADLDSFIEFQGELKVLLEPEKKALRAQIETQGYSFAAHCWRHDGKLFLLDGHQRMRVIRSMREDGWVIPPLPYSLVLADSYSQAKRKLLAAASQYGKVQESGLAEFIKDIEIKPIEIAEFRFPEINLPTFVSEHFRISPTETDQDVPGDYTTRITSPIYEPKGEKPAVSDLYDEEKYLRLSEEISAASLPPDIEEFLYAAAGRHIVFDYEKIAEFYAQADKPTQLLMEKSALVIIDFKQAIENGFVIVSKKIAETYNVE